ncbi:hypothetical protein EPUS_08439 [Endocarpon pusillum Z07020]|uniref:Uncharacterized protein n=1 Tax=Endocarpon pusillum (strain Z07020 / HMAS-L-300199) TaxID=1263415 RepID=U1I0W9_ENDPU|nr:uncharacterized protein EPUS_08439 [Endocarpon pusillum Z07020]ERF75534.1 hypothetical protein EPUS_08439 [Endocarpon pusillum Z07020]
MSSPSGSPTPASIARPTKRASPASSDTSVCTPTLSLERSGSSAPASSDRGFSTAAQSSQKSPRARPPSRPPQATRKEPTTSIERNSPITRSTAYPSSSSSFSSSSACSPSAAGTSHAREPPSSRQIPTRDAKTTTTSHDAEQIRDQLLHAKCTLLIYQTSLSQAHPGTDTSELRRQIAAQEARIDGLTRRFDAAFLDTEDEESSDGPGWIQQLNKAIREQDALIAAMGPGR